ncbi:MAG: hypothetical protein EP343_26680 [Deltaproteobacteria bacterium]|nr:MAG: hypothetical protein EP343_26680 [Deltaproteobacteria bacterium]
MLRLSLVVVLLVGGMLGCSNPESNTNTNSSPTTRKAPPTGLDPLPESLQNPSSWDELNAKIQTQCETETQNVHNVNRCVGKYRSLYCEHQGGEWTTFQNGCMDRCDVLKDPGASKACTDDEPFGCECGQQHCWDGLTCVSNP